MCKHETRDLIGTADGIRCRRCGAAFKTFAELQKAAETSEKKPKKARKKKDA